MPYNLKADNDLICQCGCIINKYYMSKHLQIAKHEREMRNRVNIEVVDHYKTNQELNVNFSLNNLKIKRYIIINKNKK